MKTVARKMAFTVVENAWQMYFNEGDALKPKGEVASLCSLLITNSPECDDL